MILRMLIVIALGGPFGVIFIVVPGDAPLGVSIVFKTFVPLILGTISVFGYSNYWFLRFKLVDETNRTSDPKDYIPLEKGPEKHQ